MVAIVSGNSLGLSLSSLATLGQKNLGGTATLGNTGEQTFVNVATGNLVVQDQDDHLMSDGLDTTILRTYNSLGTVDSDGSDTWLSGVYRQEITSTGAVNAPGSTVTRTDRDGAQAVYAWDSTAQLYRSTSGAGAYDTISYDSATSTFNFTDGATLATEKYDRATGKIISSADAHGNTTTYTLASGKLAKLVLPTGDSYAFSYGSNGALASVAMLAPNGSQVCRVRYGYDAYNRLSTVTTDLTPNDNSITDAVTYKTSYTYESSSSKRLASITQSDGTSLSFVYDSTTSRLLSVTNGLGQTTSFSYDLASRKTTVTDPLGRKTVYEYDSNGQLLSITEPTLADGTAQVTSFTYNASGDVTRMVDAMGNAVDMSYDANGNQTMQRDAVGNTVTRTYTSNNQLATQATYSVPDADGAGALQPDGAMVTRFIYDTTDPTLLRFEISAQGRVTEHRYGAAGLMLSTLQYSGVSFDTSTLGATQVPTPAQMQSWISGKPQLGMTRTDFAYDYRGQLQTQTSWAKVDAAGNGIDDGEQSIERFVHDASGKLIQSIAANGGLTQYAWDGLWRITSAADAANTVTLTSYDAASNSVKVTLANGLVTTSAYDKAGRLVTVTQATGATTLGVTKYFYDAGGQLAMTQDPTGVRAWMLYDASGRKIADIDGNGSLVETVYNADNLATRTIAYATAVNTAALVDANGLPTKPALAAIRPAASAADQNNWRLYDAAGRLCKTVDATGSVTEIVYDGASRVISTIRRANAINTASLGNAPALASVSAAADAQDRVSRNFHDADGLLRATLDAEGYLVESRYDSAGRIVRTLRYAKAASASLRATGALDQLVASTTSDSAMNAANAVTWFIYNTKGQLSGEVDAEGYLTENVYDLSGNITQSIRYATRISADPATASSVSALRPSSSAQDQSQARTYDALNRLATSTDAQGAITRFTYDSAGHLTKTECALGTSDLRTLTARYDVQGRLIGELTPEGALQLTGNQTQAQIAAIWQQFGLTHLYDAAGRRMSTTDAYGNKTMFFYNADGQLTHTVNALGEVTENQYNALGQLTAVVRYGTRIAVAGLTGALAGGLVNSTLTSAINAVKSSLVDSKTGYAYDLDGHVSTITDPLSFATNYVYNAFGEWKTRIQAVSASQSLTYTAAYDRRGLLTSSVDDAGAIAASTATVYDAFGREAQVTDALQHTRSSAYDRLGRVIMLTDALGATARTTYDAFDRVVSTTDALGKVTRYAYDSQARSVTITSPEGIAFSKYFDRLGQTLKVVDGLGNATSYSYDHNGNMLATSTALTTESRNYDRANRLIETVDTNGTHVNYTYDAVGRVLKRTVDPAGLNLQTSTTYTAKGEQLTVTDANGSVTQLAFDLKGQLVKNIVDANGLKLTTATTYDAASRVLTVTSPAGIVTRYSYDNLGRRTSQQVDPTGLNLTTSWTYDAAGNVATARDANGNITRYVYDAQNRLTFTVNALGQVERSDYDLAGQLVKTTRYASAISMAALPSLLTVDVLAQRIAPSAVNDVVRNSVYDGDGRLVATVAGTGAVVKFTYDNAGRVVDRIAYANPVSAWTAGMVPQPVADSAHDTRMRTVYDQLGRALFTVDGVGAVVSYKYDGNGNVVERVAYATKIATGTAATQASVASAVAAIADPARDTLLRQMYDAVGRITWSASGTGAVTRRIYDNGGNLAQLVQYANAIARTAAPSSAVADAADRTTSYTYDGANRLIYSVDAAGAVVKRTYDAAGNVTQSLSYANKVTLTTFTNASIASAVVPNAADRLARFAYDAVNRLVLAVDASNAAVANSYDAAGNVVKTTAYATRLVGPSLTPVASTADRVTINAYDAAGRQVYSVDGMGYVRQTQYDALDRAVSTTGFARAITLGSDISTASIAALVSTASADNRVESFVYDAASNLKDKTDAQGNSQHWTYDALGRKLSFTNEVGSIWTYNWDASGHMVSERSPQVPWLEMLRDSSGTLNGSVWHADSLLTVLNFDALGNLTSRTEAAGIAGSERVTRYEYDSLGRQVRTIFPPVGVYDAAGDDPAANGATGAPVRTETTRPLATSVTYNTLGDAVSGRDLAGSDSYKVYDKLGRVQYAIDALGFTTEYSYDAFGSAVKLTRYASKISVPAPGANGLTSAQVGALLAALPHASDRSIATVYDALGRVSMVTQAAAVAFDADQPAGAEGSVQASKVTTNTYNAFGELVYTTDGKASTDYYYDRCGMQVASVDAMGYLTQQSWDGARNLQARVEFSNALPSWTSARLTSTPPAAIGSSTDRTTFYIYDNVGRKLRETLSASAGTPQNIVTQYAWDKLGNLVATTNALGGTSYNYYDALGRLIAATTPAPDAASNAPLTDYYRDIFGNAVMTVARAKGAVNPTASQENGTSGPDDRIEAAAYDSFGRVTEKLDAGNVTRYFSYTERGELAKSWLVNKDESGVKTTIYQVLDHDKLGRVIHSRDPAPSALEGGAPSSISTDTTYNAFGEMTSRAVAGVAGSEYWEYDNAGHLVKTNAGDGVDRVMLYDVWGRATVELRSGGIGSGDADLRNMTQVQALSATGVRRTTTRYDALGRVIKQTLPDQLELQGGVAVSSMATGGQVVQSATPPSNYGAGWGGANQVNLSWVNIGGLGSGDVKVVLSYTTVAHDEFTTPQGSELLTGTAPVAPMATTYTSILTADKAATGATLQWTDSGSHGGISAITGVAIYKKDANGYWQKLVDQSAFGDAGKIVTLAAPTDPQTKTELQIRALTAPPSGTWVSQPLTNFGDQLRFDASAIAGGFYEFRVLVTPPGATSAVSTASGTFDLSGASIATIAQPLTTTGDGNYQWPSPGPGTTQMLRYRLAGNTTDVWRTLAVTDAGTGVSIANASALPAGQYDYELLYSNVGSFTAYAHATGQLKVDAAIGTPPVAGVQFTGFDDGTAKISWTPRIDGSTAVARWRIPGTTTWTAGTILTDAAGRPYFMMPALAPTAPATVFDVQVTLSKNGLPVAMSESMVTFGVQTTATAVDHTPDPLDSYTTPQVGVSPVGDFNFVGGTDGSGTFSWPATAVPVGGHAVFEIRQKYAGFGFADKSSRITTSNGVQQVSFTADEIVAGVWETQLTIYDAQNVKVNFSTSDLTTYAQQMVAPTSVNTTSLNAGLQPAQNLPVIASTFTGNTDGSWQIVWNKDTSGATATVQYHLRADPNVATDVNATGWVSGTVAPVGTTQQMVAFTANALPKGAYDVRVIFTSGGVQTAQSWRAVTLPSGMPTSADKTVGQEPAQSIPLGGAPEIQGASMVANSPSKWTMSWPASGATTYVKYRAHGSNSTWMLLALTTPTSRELLASDFADGDWDVQVDQVTSGALTGRNTVVLTVANGTCTRVDATLYAPAGGYVPGRVLRVPGASYAPNVSGSGSTIAWSIPPSGTTANLRYRPRGVDAWTTFPFTQGALTQSHNIAAAAFAPGQYEVELELVKGSGTSQATIVGRQTYVLTVGNGGTHSIVDATTAYTSASASFTDLPAITNIAWGQGLSGGSTFSWDNPPIGSASHFFYRRGSTGAWSEKPVSLGPPQSVTLPPTSAVDSGDWEFKIEYTNTSTGVVSNRSAGVLSIAPDGIKHYMADATLRAMPMGGYTPLPGLTWTTSSQTGTTLTWAKPASGSVVITKKARGSLGWSTATLQLVDGGSTQSANLPIGIVPPGDWDIEVSTVVGGVVTSRSALRLTVAADNSQTMVRTGDPYLPATSEGIQGVPVLATTFTGNASAGSWTLGWAGTGAPTLRYRLAGTSTWTTSNKTTSGTTQVTFTAGELGAPGTYEVDLFYGTATARTSQSLRTVTVAANSPSSIDITPTYVPATSGVSIPAIALNFAGYADGTWALNWPRAPFGTHAVLKYTPPGATQPIDATSQTAMTADGTTQYINVSVQPPGLYYIDLAYIDDKSGDRVQQATMTVTVTDPHVKPTDVITATDYAPAVFHPASNIQKIAVAWTPNADGSWRMRFPVPPAGSVAHFATRIKSTTQWTERTPVATGDGYLQVDASATDFQAGSYDVDIYYALNGVRTDQAQGDLIISRTPLKPVSTDDMNTSYVPAHYFVSQDAMPSSAIGAQQAFVFAAQTGVPPSITSLAFANNADGSASLQWNKLGNNLTPKFEYRLVGTSTWLALPVTLVGSVQRVTVQPTAGAGLYDVKLSAIGNNGVAKDQVTGTWIVPRASGSATTSSSFNTQAIVNRKLDRWGNVLEINDARSQSWITKYEYNVFDQVVRQTLTDANGNTTGAGVATTTIQYDALGRQTRVVDTNGNASSQQWDAAGRLTTETHADGGQVKHTFDIFGEETQTTNEIGIATNYTWNKRHLLVQSTSAAVDVRSITDGVTWALQDGGSQQITHNITWDAAGRKTSEWDATQSAPGVQLNLASYKYDLRGNVIATTQAGHGTVRSAWDALGHQIAARDANGANASWRYDYFGQLTAHTDFGGTTYQYTFDHARQLTQQTNSRGQHLAYGWNVAGRLTRITDTGSGHTQVTDYSFDLSGHRIREKTTQDGVVFQDNHLAYDALGRMRNVSDSRASITIDYDKLGNRTHIHTHVINATSSSESTQDSDRYFQYDAMGRQTVIDAVDASGTLGTNGHRITYDAAGNKRTDTWVGNVVDAATLAVRQGETTESYSYDALSRLTTIQRDGTLVDARYYDAAGNLAQSGAVLNANYAKALYGANNQGAVLQGNGSEIRKNIYGTDGLLYGQKVLDTSGTQVQYQIWNTARDAAGNITQYQRDSMPGNPAYLYTNAYEVREGYLEKSVTGVHIGGGGSGTTTSTYDANGFLTSVTDSAQSANNRTFVNDAAGRVLYARQGDHVQRQLVVNGEVLGRYGEVIDDKVARTADGTPSFTTMADFQFGSQATGGNTPTRPDTTHTVGAGDSLKSLAKAYYGDERLWYRIAEANGLFTSDELTAGQVLKIPGTESSLNGAGTFKPYDPSKVVGDTTPFVPLPKAKGMSFFGQVLMAVVSIMVAVYTAGLLSGASGALMTTMQAGAGALTGGAAGAEVGAFMGGSMSAAEIAGVGAASAATGSIASQGVAVAGGAQSGISWKSVGLSAASAGFSGGLGGVNFGLGEGNVIAQAAVANALTQGIGVVTGLQDHFSWQSVAASAVGAGVGQAVGGATGMNDPQFTSLGFSEQFGPRLVTGLAAGAATAIARGGRVAVQQIAVDAFGHALGESIASDSTSAKSDDQLGDFIQENPADQDRRNRYSLSTGREVGGLKLGGRGQGVRLSEDAVFEWAANVDQGTKAAGVALADSGPTLLDSVNRAYGRSDATYGTWDAWSLVQTGGGTRPPVQIVRSAAGEATAQAVADPWALLGPGLTGGYSDVESTLAKYNNKVAIDEIRTRLGAGGRNVPEVGRAIGGPDGQMSFDYSAAQLDRFKIMDNFENLRRQGIVALDANWNVTSVASGREMFVKTRDVRFTQEWVNYKSSDGVNNLDTTGAAARVAAEKIPAMDVVVMPDGRLTSVDNRRLTAGYLYDADNMKVIIRANDDALPDARAMQRFSWNQYDAKTWGDAALIRVYKQSPEFRETFRLGSPVVPLIRNAPVDPLYLPYQTTPQRRR